MISESKITETAKSKEVWKLADGKFTRSEVSIVIEQELPIYVNGQHLVTASITPIMEKEFVAGYLFGQGFLDSFSDIESIRIENNTARVTLTSAGKMLKRAENASQRIVSGGGKAVYFEKAVLPEINSQVVIGKMEIFKAMNAIFEKAGIYRDTEGVHTAGLYKPDGTPIYIAEDIGRHNTLDKVIGYTLINRIDCANTFLVTTGRMASEMVAKLCRAKIPVVATKTAAIKIGSKYGLTIIGFVRDIGNRINTDMEVRVIHKAGMKIYTHPERIAEN